MDLPPFLGPIHRTLAFRSTNIDLARPNDTPRTRMPRGSYIPTKVSFENFLIPVWAQYIHKGIYRTMKWFNHRYVIGRNVPKSREYIYCFQSFSHMYGVRRIWLASFCRIRNRSLFAPELRHRTRTLRSQRTSGPRIEGERNKGKYIPLIYPIPLLAF